MTIYSSAQISQMIYAQQQMASGQMAYAQQLSYPGQAAMYPGMPPPPAMPAMGPMAAMRGGVGGMYGEQLAARMGSIGTGAMGLGIGSLGVGMSLAGVATDPLSGALGGLLAGGGMGGALAGAAGGAAVMLPLMAAGQAAKVYGGAFMGGMNEQAGLNSVLRNNFRFMGGQGAFGRGFNQQQMGQIGSMISGELRNNPFTSSGEMSSLIAGGAESGMLTAVRDVQSFTQQFRKMINTLKDVQRELGGSLTDALQFVRESKQAGIYQTTDRMKFATEIRSAEAVTGMSRDQLMGLSVQGAGIARAFGGVGRQGAMGALRAASTLGSAVSTGAINEELLSEATGGLTGNDAIQAFTARMMQRSGQFSRTAAGRFSLFAMSNEQGTGLDQDMLQRFMQGDVTAGEISRTAHRNVNRMGRARALNREGLLRGDIMEQGGMAAQIGIMRQVLGDRVLDQGDDLAQLVMRRRFGMGREEAQLTMGLIRNQGAIAQNEMVTRSAAGREQALRTDIAQNRSLDAFMAQLEHGVSDQVGLTRTREMGRSFMTRISSLAERAMNDILGVAASGLTMGDRTAVTRLGMGQATAGDLQRLSQTLQAGGRGGGLGTGGLSRLSAAQEGLRALGIEGGSTPAEAFAQRGINIAGMSMTEVTRQAQSVELARQGIVSGADRGVLARMMQDREGTMGRIGTAQLMAAGAGDPNAFYRFMGGSANATDAFMQRNGLAMVGNGISQGSLLDRGGNITGGMVLRDIGRLAINPMGISGMGPLAGGSEIMRALGEGGGGRMAWLASGGAMGRALRGVAGSGMMDAAEWGSGNRGMMRLMTGIGGDQLNAMMGGSARGRAALLANGMNVSQDAMGALANSDEFQGQLGQLLSASGPGGMSGRISQMQQWALQQQDPEQRRAALSVVQQARFGMLTSFARTGRFDVGSDVRGLQGLTPEQRSRAAALRTELSTQGAGLLSAGDQLQGLGGGLAGLLRKEITGAGNLFQGIGAGTSSDISGADAATRQIAHTLATADPQSQEYRDIVGRLGQTEQGRQLLASAAGDRRLMRELGGQGRRGSRGAMDALTSAVSGGSFGSMEFTGAGGRTITGQQARAMLLRGGRGAQDIMGQFQTQLEGMGVGHDEAHQLSQELSMGTRAIGAHGRLGTGAIERVMRETGSSDALRKIQAQGAEQAMAAERGRNPLGAQQVDLLKEIRDRLPERAASKTDSDNTRRIADGVAGLADHLSSLIGGTPRGEAA